MKLFIEKNSDIQKSSIALEGNSLFLFGKKNRIRLLLSRIVGFQQFDNMILCFIFISTGLLMLEEPLADPKSSKK